MATEFQEPEEKELDKASEESKMMDDFNPLDEPIMEKAYTRPNVKFGAKDMTDDIPEPSFIPPLMGGDTLTAEQQKIKKPPIQPQEPFNPQLKDVPKKDKRDAANKVAKMIMTGYKMVNEYADKSLQFNQRKIAKMQMNGEIDLSTSIPITPTTEITAGEFIQEYNEQSLGTITVSKEFEEEVTPVLTRVLEKRGIGMTDEQELLYLVGKDVVVKGFMMQQSLVAKKETLLMIKELGEARKVQFNPPPPPPPYNTESQYQQPPSPPPPYNSGTEFYPEEEYNVEQEQGYVNPNEAPNVNDVVNQMVGAVPPPPPPPKPKSKPKNTGVTILVDAQTAMAKRGKGRPKIKR